MLTVAFDSIQNHEKHHRRHENLDDRVYPIVKQMITGRKLVPGKRSPRKNRPQSLASAKHR
jgi:hypothetical protein